ncbi:MAG: hypothetical protein ACOCP8_04110 [archaeon]
MATPEEPLQFTLYSPAAIQLSLNYTHNDKAFSAYQIIHNDKVIYTTLQGENFIPQLNDVAEIGPGNYIFMVDTLALPGNNNHVYKNSLLQVTVKADRNPFVDPMIEEMQRQQEQQMQEQQMQEQQMQQQMEINNTIDINDPFLGMP